MEISAAFLKPYRGGQLHIRDTNRARVGSILHTQVRGYTIIFHLNWMAVKTKGEAHFTESKRVRYADDWGYYDIQRPISENHYSILMFDNPHYRSVSVHLAESPQLSSLDSLLGK